MRFAIRTVLSAIMLAGAMLTPALAQDPLKLTVGAMENGTVFWELEAMKALGLDKANNVELDVRAAGRRQGRPDRTAGRRGRRDPLRLRLGLDPAQAAATCSPSCRIRWPSAG